jgi:arylsulfatase A-like enzyme
VLLRTSIAVALLALGCNARPGLESVTIAPIESATSRSAGDPGDLLSRAPEPDAIDGALRITSDMPDANRHFSGGWSAPAVWDVAGRRVARRWSVGPASRIRFDLARVSPLTLALRAVAFQPPGGRLQRVDVWVNEQFVSSFALEPVERVYAIDLPEGALRSGENVVRFAYLWTEQPVRVTPGALDQRALAMALSEIVIRRDGVAAAAAKQVSVTTPDREAPARALLQTGSVTTSVLVWPPAASQLEVGWVRLRDTSSDEATTAPVRYRVVVEWDHGERVVLAGEEAEVWRRESAALPLPLEATGPIRVRFEVASDDPDTRWLWIEPRIAAVPPLPPPNGVETATAPPVEVAAPAPPSLRLPAGTPIVILVLDATQRARLGVYGSTTNATPHIDRLSRDALVFDSAYASASFTLASTASLFTSLLPSDHGVLDDGDRLAESIPTLAQALQAKGYATAAFSGNPYVSRVTNVTHGFETSVELFRDKPLGQIALGAEFLRPFREWIEQHRERPFFAYVHLIQPHEPYDAAPAEWYAGRIDPGYQGPFDGSQEQMGQIYQGSLHPAAADRAQIRGLYEGNLAYSDKIVGELLRTLGENRVFENAIVVVTSDHGESLGERGVYGHSTSVDREQIAIPLVVRLPNATVSPGRRPELVSSIDVMPSLLALVGIEPPRGLRGRNWFEDTAAGRAVWPRSISAIAEGESGTVGVLVPGFKYSFDQASGRERLAALPDEEDGANLRWERPVTFAYLAAEAARLTEPHERDASQRTGVSSADVEEALRSLGYAK